MPMFRCPHTFGHKETYINPISTDTLLFFAVSCSVPDSLSDHCVSFYRIYLCYMGDIYCIRMCLWGWIYKAKWNKWNLLSGWLHSNKSDVTVKTILISCTGCIIPTPVSMDGQQMRVSILFICCLCISFVIRPQKRETYTALIYF